MRLTPDADRNLSEVFVKVWFNHSRLLAPNGHLPRSSAKSITIPVKTLQPWWQESRNSVSERPCTVDTLMPNAPFPNAYDGLKVGRLIMVLSSLAPLFFLWGIRGTRLIPDEWFVTGCLLLATLPTVFLWLRFERARSQKDLRHLVAGPTEDHRNHVLVYLFAILLPFYRQDLASGREFAAMLVALAFIVFLFWRLNLHYMNIFFAFLHYRVFTVFPPMDENPYTGRVPFVLITRRHALSPGDSFNAYRISDTVYLESSDAP